jgi:hypothetical protein
VRRLVIFLVSATSLLLPRYCFGQPGVKIIQPNGGEKFGVGQTMTIKWWIDTTVILKGLAIQLSNDGGMWWGDISGEALIGNSDSVAYAGPADTGTFKWKITAKIGETSIVDQECIVQAVAPYEEAGFFADASDAPFTISEGNGVRWTFSENGSARFAPLQTRLTDGCRSISVWVPGGQALDVYDTEGRLIAATSPGPAGFVSFRNSGKAAGSLMCRLRGAGPSFSRTLVVW